ncbi:hypothetical protein HMPREF0216_00365 [Clostridium celatum DSM 1785]|uniref:Uncharacterized protein n=1 Tax=Clostridium celatum DSM 1785 TaxID=545697 RepID=L1QM44_9CLOT|nr:hypothetical protein [Clostridium celatum]EKY29006.1 hypothetical protein HMPREF0216_00365 [Clostridium celatum DSM 1785]
MLIRLNKVYELAMITSYFDIDRDEIGYFIGKIVGRVISNILVGTAINAAGDWLANMT